MNYVFEKNIQFTPVKFILDPWKDDVLNFMGSEDEAWSAANAAWDAIVREKAMRLIRCWAPAMVTPYVKDGKKYNFYGFHFEKDGVPQPRQFFLFEIKSR